MSWWDSYRAVYRAELKASALELAERGWPVLPGTYQQAGSWTGLSETEQTDADQTGPAPALVDGVAQATLDRATVEDWWSARPYSVLVATGVVMDAIEVSALVGRRVSALLRDAGQVTPVAATPTGRWWFAVRPGEALRPELASRSDVVLHGRGSWVAAPPSEGPQGVVHWRISPNSCRWRLADHCPLQAALLDVLGQRPSLAASRLAAGSVGTGIRS